MRLKPIYIVAVALLLPFAAVMAQLQIKGDRNFDSSTKVTHGSVNMLAEKVTTAFSATPTFTANSKTLTSFHITLTGNVTSSTLSGATTGQVVVFNIIQDGTGGHSFVPPTNVLGFGVIDTTASVTCSQHFVFDGTNAIATGSMTCPGAAPGIVLPGSTSGSTKLAAAAVASGTITFPAGTTNFTGTGGTSQVLKQSSTGAPLTVGQLACADLSDSGAGCSGAGGGGVDISTAFRLDWSPYNGNGFDNAQTNGWATGATCADGTGSGSGISLASIFTSMWMTTTTASNSCYYSWPRTGSGELYANGIHNLFSGGSPKRFVLRVWLRHVDNDGEFWIGLFTGNGATSTANFLGCRYDPTNNLDAVIRGASADVDTTDVTWTHETTAWHKFEITNLTTPGDWTSAAASGNIKCSIDGGTAGAATGTIPTGDIYWVLGIYMTSGGSAATDVAFSRIQFVLETE